MLDEASVAHFLSEIDVDPSAYLFHYTSPESLKSILEYGTVRLNSLDNMNDPREKKTWTPRHLLLPEGEMTLESLARADLIHAEPDRLLREGARIACFTRERTRHEDADPTSLFHRGWARARMWDTYGRKHAGACLVFDYGALPEALFDAVPVAEGNVQAVSPVTYQDRPLDIPLQGTYGSMEEIRSAIDDLTGSGHTIGDLFFTKNTDWKSEDEVRVLMLRWSPGEPLEDGPVDLPYGQSLLAVVLGEDFVDDGWLEKALEKQQIADENVLRVAWVDGAPRLRHFNQVVTRLV